ncbi:uncharacterized protein LOC110452484 [Mizuhopecten yessoensis]|uniref:uncharacterized protein LOC110452484 n=1 Tax=Mizuhopecten yessoensis TaxID=6573 RepID=UPI000B45C925|nr:uncharacterized protein LOC110452484 [Mizuhopecten yessoensis]
MGKISHKKLEKSGNAAFTVILVIGIFTVVNYLFPLTYRGTYRRLITSAIYPSNDKSWANNLLLCPEKIGRLGNTMFQYASSYGIAKEVQRELVLPVDDRLWKYFHITAKAVYNRTFTCERWKHERIDFTGIWEKHIYEKVKRSPENVMLRHYFQSWKFFEKYKKEIKLEFSLKDSIKNSANKIIRDTAITFYPIGTAVTFIGVHVRRGDYLRIRFSSFGYNIAPSDYVIRAIKYCLSRYTNPMFIVCTEDVEWTRDELKSLPDAHIEFVFHENSPEVDFGLLVACNHTIMTVGSFGWWAGYLAGGLVLMSLMMVIMMIILENISIHLSSKSNERPNNTFSSRQSTAMTVSSDVRKTLKNDFKLCPGAIGRLGNQMFVYASTYGIARSVNRTLVIPKDDILRNVFKLTAHIMPNRSLSCARWKHVYPKFSSRYDGNINNRVMGYKSDISLRKYLQSSKYFEKYKSEILLEFSLKDELKVVADSILYQAAKSLSVDSEGNTVTYLGFILGVETYWWKGRYNSGTMWPLGLTLNIP